MAKAEISWKRVTEDGEVIQAYAQHVSREWRFFLRGKRFDQWRPEPNPCLEDWLELLDSVRRRIGRGYLKPEEEFRVITMIRDRFPEAKIP
jgi:hypothetical protein